MFTGRARTAIITTAAVAALALPAGAWAAGADTAATSTADPAGCAVGDEFARTELFFGLSRPGGRITNAQFEDFVDREVTKRFPDGLTIVRADGQFKDSSGTIIEERSRLVILLYPSADPESSTAIEDIRSAYRYEFDQESVLRTDESSCVSF